VEPEGPEKQNHSEIDQRVVQYDPLIEFMSRFENVKTVDTSADPFQGLSIEERLKKHIVDGIKKNLQRHLEFALQSYDPLTIVNEILLDGMKKVGELFGSGQMQLPFVLQSAEVMKTAVAFLEPRMEKIEGTEKGSILLATVAGDVHDIGKNLVDIILSNNGYRVVNIGIKQPINAIIEQAQKHDCEVIGMSGLLVKSTVIMKENLQELNDRGLSAFPVILGGAALTRAYVEDELRSIYNGRVFYAQDAFEGLHLMGHWNVPAETDGLRAAVADEPDGGDVHRIRSHRTHKLDEELYEFRGVRSATEPSRPLVPLPFFGPKTRESFDVFEIYKYINPIALFRGQWQYKRPQGMGNIEFAEMLAAEAEPIFVRLQRTLANVLQPKVTWGYFPCRSEGNDLILFQEGSQQELLRFCFPRQRDAGRLCISDYFLPTSQASQGEFDTVGFHIVTVGHEVTALERELFEKGDFREYLFVHGMGVEFAEALAEYWHQQMRYEMGIAEDEPSLKKLLFSAKYRGARYSFGYPACPNLEDQSKLFELLMPEKIGVSLSEEYMLEPEQSTSAIIVSHPEAKYFNVR